MKLCLVTAFPPSNRQLNEYALHIATELRRNPSVNLMIVADHLDTYEFVTDADGNRQECGQEAELPGFHVTRCWKFNSMATPVHLLKAIYRIRPDVVWFNLVFSTFGTPRNPVAAFAGLCVPALTRASGFYTHVTLHHIIEHVDFAGAGVKRERFFRLGSDIATRILLQANSVSVLLSGYQRTLSEKYSAENVLLGTHGIFTQCPTAPNLAKRGTPDHRILAIGHWGTYKRLETLIAAFPAVLEKIPNARLVIAGGNHHTTPGYWESVRESVRGISRIEFHGYVAEEMIPELFKSSSVMTMPYDSSTGSSGPAHLACEFGVPIVCADIPDFRDMARDEEMAVTFYKKGDATDLAGKLIGVLESRDRQRQMAEQNFSAALRMTMPRVVRHYLRWFELERCKQTLGSIVEPRSRPRSWRASVGSALFRRFSTFSSNWTLQSSLRGPSGLSSRGEEDPGQ